jgi:DNA-binding NtrC family response regulator
LGECYRGQANELAQATQRERHVLLVDPDGAFGQVLQTVLGPGYELHRISSVEKGISHLDEKNLDVILLNLDLPCSGSSADDPRDLLKAASERPVAPPVIVYSWDATPGRAMEAFQLAAADFLEQPLDIRELKFALDAAYRRANLTRDLVAAKRFLQSTPVEGLLGNSKSMERVNEVIRKVADVATTVLITGESGTGKGVVAQAIHRLSPRADRPFVAFSPCALPESLIEDELFGHEKGAFTGAAQPRRGRFEEANGGTIFLDEIGDLALPLQAKLLRVLQERSLERLGSNVAHPVDVRVICATSRNLEKMVQEGTFREDLYFRISVVRIPMPPLRERREDIPLLAEYFFRMFAKAHNKRARGLTTGYLSALAGHGWPGNIRELQNVIERSLVLANGNLHLGVEDLPQELRGLTVSSDVAASTFHQGVRSFKRELVRSALRMHAGNKLRAAQELRISRCYLHRLLNQLNIKDEGSADGAGRAPGALGPLAHESASARREAEVLKVGSQVA